MTWARVITFVLHSQLIIAATSPTSSSKKTYIVQMRFQQKPLAYNTHSDWYTALLQSAAKSNSPDSLLYTYDAAYHGFAASLSPSEAQSLARSDSVLAVHDDVVYSLHTTRTPLFLGLKNLALWEGNTLEKLNHASQDVVIGVLDSGVWPESPSFNDDDMPEKPRNWGGKCDPGEQNPKFCNKKLIGARFFNKGYSNAVSSNESGSARDNEGHGTHTSSTAAGSQVTNASLFGYARGKARGVAYKARVAMYKVCWEEGCYGSDIVAAVDTATRDGVHVLSLSLGGGPGTDYYMDPIAVAAFGAMEKGIFVSCSAGNSGPYEGSVVNVAPWIMTVGAGTLDRDFPAFVVLENGRNFTGVSLYSGKDFGRKPVELVYGVGKDTSGSNKLCMEGSLDSSVRGKVVLCDRGGNARVAKGAVVSGAGGVGMILANTEDNGEELVADSHFLPAVAVGFKTGDEIRNHIKTTKHPTAFFSFGGTVVKVQHSPVVAAFSSRGPNPVTPQILKPDVVGPGVNILAGWSQAVGPTSLPADTRRTEFNIVSGTSMSCPHVSGLAGLMKAAHPDWSPGAIKSALITTAHAVDNTKSPFLDAATGNISTPFGHGGGYINLHRALTPGFVYNATSEDYIAFLCSIGYSVDMVRSIARRSNVDCKKKVSDPGQLNYPSFSVVFKESMVLNYSREVTNVDGDGVYRVKVRAPENVVVSVEPSELVFKGVGEKRRYVVTFASREGVEPGMSSFGNIVWKSGKKQVKSPVSVSWDG